MNILYLKIIRLKHTHTHTHICLYICCKSILIFVIKIQILYYSLLYHFENIRLQVCKTYTCNYRKSYQFWKLLTTKIFIWRIINPASKCSPHISILSFFRSSFLFEKTILLISFKKDFEYNHIFNQPRLTIHPHQYI